MTEAALGVTTVGFGHPLIYATYSSVGNTAAVTNFINYDAPFLSGQYRLSGVVNVTAWTTPASFTVVVVYKDDSGTTRTETAFLTRGSSGGSAAAINAVDRWYFSLPLISIDATSSQNITVSTSGTFTGSPVYNIDAVLEQLS